MDWDRLLTEIEERHVVPIVGPELLPTDKGDACTALLYDHVAQELRKKFIPDSAPKPQVSIDEVIDEQLARAKASGYDLNDVYHDVYYWVRNILNQGNWSVPDPLPMM